MLPDFDSMDMRPEPLNGAETQLEVLELSLKNDAVRLRHFENKHREADIVEDKLALLSNYRRLGLSADEILEKMNDE